MSWAQVKEIGEALQSVLTCLAIVLAGIWTYMLFIKTRQKYPRVQIQHDVKHWELSTNENVLRVGVRVSNIGEVLLPLESVTVRLHWIRPCADDSSAITEEAENERTGTICELEWPMLYERTSRWSKHEQEIEPGEMDEFVCDFILSEGVEAVSVYSYVKNAYKKRHRFKRWKSREIGWKYYDCT